MFVSGLPLDSGGAPTALGSETLVPGLHDLRRRDVARDLVLGDVVHDDLAAADACRRCRTEPARWWSRPSSRPSCHPRSPGALYLFARGSALLSWICTLPTFWNCLVFTVGTRCNFGRPSARSAASSVALVAIRPLCTPRSPRTLFRSEMVLSSSDSVEATSVFTLPTSVETSEIFGSAAGPHP